MTYATKGSAYADPETRRRIGVCATEQAYIYVNDLRPEVVQLAQRVISREPLPLDALAAGVTASPNGDTLAEDGALLSAMQAVWPAVAAALYIPEAVDAPPE